MPNQRSAHLQIPSIYKYPLRVHWVSTPVSGFRRVTKSVPELRKFSVSLRVFHPWPYGHFEPDSSLLWAASCPVSVRNVAATLAPTH